MARTSPRDLNQMAHHIENVTGLSVMIDWAYGAPRLVSGDGSREISPRLPSGQLMDWMRAFLAGYDACDRPDAPSWSAMRRTNPRHEQFFRAGTVVRVRPTAPGSETSYPAAKWLKGRGETTVTLLEDARSGGLDVYDVETTGGAQESIYGFNILGRVAGRRNPRSRLRVSGRMRAVESRSHAPYAWLITRDHLAERYPADFGTEVGTAGPRDASDAMLNDLRTGKGVVFTIYDDDGELYYTGRLIGQYDGTEPLNDFGTPNAGATSIIVGGERIV